MKPCALAIATSLLVSSTLSADEDPFVVNLKDPEYSEGVVKTNKGGVITAPGLRIQAKQIHLINRKDEQSISAQGDLLMEYEGRYFVGEKLEFDFIHRTGYLVDGRANIDIWYMGGNHVRLDCDGTLFLDTPFLTTSVNRKNPWAIRANSARVSDGEILSAKNITLRALNVPLLWLPSYSTNLRKMKDPAIRYRGTWDTGLGPKLSFRYRFFSTDTFNAYARLDYRFKYLVETKKIIPRGLGGALEADYASKDKLATFQTRNYGALDKIFPDENGSKRFRFQGIYKVSSQDKYSKFHVQWDRMSDDRMVGDFRDTDFEINTQKTTYLEGLHYSRSAYTGLTLRPKINHFDTLNQELPTGVVALRPLTFWNTGVIMENYASGSYLDYTFANQLDKILQDRKSGRVETLNTLYRPFSFWGTTITPRIGLVGIYYTQSPDKQAVGQLLGSYGGDANIRFSKRYSHFKHTIEPYARYVGYTRPTVSVDDYYVFNINDGYDKLDQLRFGIRQLYFLDCNPIFLPGVIVDLYAYSFWGAESFTQRIPKAFIDVEYNKPTYALKGGLAWNIQESLLDYGNVNFLWTLSSSVALGLEFRHRSKFWWRKAVHDNFVVDFARPIDELLASPLADGRNTFLTKAHFRLSPRWNLQLQTFHGWGRADEHRYNGAKVDLYTMVTGNWQMKLSYEYMPNDPIRVSYSFKLIK